MGFEVTYICHPKKEEGVGYDMENTEEITRSVGKPFDDTTLQKLADAIVAQMARRDCLVVDVKVEELTRKAISFKESKDGKAIVLKGKRFPLDGTSAPDPVEVTEMVLSPENNGGLQPHEIVARQQYQQQVSEGVQPHEAGQSLDRLYGNANAPIPIKRSPPQARNVNQKRVMYEVYFEPSIQYVNMVKSMGLDKQFTMDNKYPVHDVIPDPLGRLDNQKLIVTDNAGKIREVEDKFFVSAGRGLLADDQLGFSGPNKRGERRPNLMYENEMVRDAPAQMDIPQQYQGIPVDDGTIPQESFQIPDIRPGKGVM